MPVLSYLTFLTVRQKIEKLVIHNSKDTNNFSFKVKLFWGPAGTKDGWLVIPGWWLQRLQVMLAILLSSSKIGVSQAHQPRASPYLTRTIWVWLNSQHGPVCTLLYALLCLTLLWIIFLALKWTFCAWSFCYILLVIAWLQLTSFPYDDNILPFLISLFMYYRSIR